MFEAFSCKKKIKEFEKRLVQLTLDTDLVITFLKGIYTNDEELTLVDRIHNKDLLHGLLEIKFKYDKLSKEDEYRNWVFTGTEQIVNIIRGNTFGYESTLNSLTSTLCKYARANQAAIFVLNIEDSQNEFLELKSVYAYDKKRYVSKIVRMGEGLVSQCYLEGSPIYMTDVPLSYVKITSGLGEATPRSIILIPLIFDTAKVGVIEFAFFHKLQPFEIDFLNKVAEHIASYIVRENQNSKTKIILEYSEKQTSLLISREEELKQSMDKMRIIHEQMDRRNRDLELANLEIESKTREMDELKRHEMELFESKLETQKAIHRLTIKKLNEKIAELESKGQEQVPRLRVVN